MKELLSGFIYLFTGDDKDYSRKEILIGLAVITAYENQDKFIEGMTYSELAGIKYDKLTYLKAHVSNNSGNNEWYTPENYIESARELSC